jgi:hypothetical protein
MLDSILSRAKTAIAAMAAVVALAACASLPPGPVYPEITYKHLPPYRMNAARLEIVDNYVPPLTADHVEHLAPIAPAALLRRWAEDRFVAAGGSGVVRVVIENASIVEQVYRTNQELTDMVTTERASLYTAGAAVRIEMLDDYGNSQAYVAAKAERSRSIPEGITLREREEILFQMTDDLVKDLNGTIEPRIGDYLAGYIL